MIFPVTPGVFIGTEYQIQIDEIHIFLLADIIISKYTLPAPPSQITTLCQQGLITPFQRKFCYSFTPL